MSRVLDLDKIASLVHEAGVACFVAHTGGGVATLYAGTHDAEGLYQACAGPGYYGPFGSIDGRAYADRGDLVVGTDGDTMDDGSAYVTTHEDTEATIADRVLRLVRGEVRS